ncbi:MAG: Na/Pi cotransporter family protein [Silicimonas sp.]|nr:Na/Pi cotransporter family protein [Silicimonas sp.]
MAILGFILEIFAAVMLLLFAVRLVRTGIERQFGGHFARYLSGQTSGVMAALAGVVLAIMLQSSAAVALLLSGFAATGVLGFPTGFAALLGADLGSAIVIQFLSFDLSWLEPILLVVGGWLFLKSERQTLRLIGRIILGLALILVALHLLREAVEPLSDSDVLPALAGYIAADNLTGFLIGALLAFLLHSSVATILMVVAIVVAGVMPFAPALAIVMGANLGSALVALWLTRDMPLDARRVPVANAILRGALALAALYIITTAGLTDRLIVAGPAASLVLVHIGFNLLLVLLFAPLSHFLEAPMRALMPSPAPDTHAAFETPLSALERTDSIDSAVALSSMRQEILQMLEEVERMYRPILSLYDDDSPGAADRIRNRDERVNQLFTNLRRFLAENARERLTKSELKQSRALLEYAIRVEAAGDLVSKRLTAIAREKHTDKVEFSKAGRDELVQLHALVLSGFGLARHVLLVDDVEAARRLVLDKAEVKRRERASRKAHLKRLETGETDSFASSEVHLETLRALRELYGHLAAVAYPILYRTGQVLETRLVTDPMNRKADA